NRNGGHRRYQHVEIDNFQQAAALRPLRDAIENHRRNEQCDRKVDQHYVLSVLGQNNRLKIERINHRRPLIGPAWRLRDPLPPTVRTARMSLTVDNSRSRVLFRFPTARFRPQKKLIGKGNKSSPVLFYDVVVSEE